MVSLKRNRNPKEIPKKIANLFEHFFGETSQIDFRFCRRFSQEVRPCQIYYRIDSPHRFFHILTKKVERFTRSTFLILISILILILIKTLPYQKCTSLISHDSTIFKRHIDHPKEHPAVHRLPFVCSVPTERSII